MLVEPWIQEEQLGFRLGRETLGHLFTLSRVHKEAWEFVQPVYECFDLKKQIPLFPEVPCGKCSMKMGLGFAATGLSVHV